MEQLIIIIVSLFVCLGFIVLSYFKLRKGFMRKGLMITLGIVSTALILSIGYKVQNEEVLTPSKLNTVGSEENLIKMINEYRETSNQHYFWGIDNFVTADGVMEQYMVDSPTSGGYDKSVDYSKTNTQVDGVDEADIVKTDGRYLYEVGYNEVFIVSAYPEDSLGLDKTIDYQEQNFTPSELYIDDDYLVVLGVYREEIKVEYKKHNKDDETDSSDIEYYTTYETNARIYVYDKQNNFEQIHTIDLDGYTLSSRKIGSQLYIITRKHINIEMKNTKKIAPDYTIDGTRKQVDYEDMYFIDHTNPDNFINIASLDLNHIGESIDIFTLLGSGRNIYMSKENLYIVENQYNYSLLDRVTNNTVESTKSVISKLRLNEGKTEYVATATVPGTIINQFSMDEHEGNFRIATTSGNTWDETSKNNLYILDEDMNRLGEVTGLAKGERIKSSRFVGDRIYIITFRQIDPFFVIDASNSNKPEVLGELKIPGFSTYLHPYDQNHVIGFGFEGNNEGRITGLKMALYDVTDPTNPIEKHKETFLYEDYGYSHSDVTYNHKALLFNKQKNVLAFPLSGREYRTVTISENGKTYQETRTYFKQNYVVYGLNPETGFTKRGEITHFEPNENSHSYRIERGVYIENFLYTVSKGKVQINELSTLDYIDELSLPVSKQNHYYYFK
ncbi:beta-propeller domain-containing protein [Haloplasma contractile]|uniref:Beta propeller domain protein n=1 Tax=Haloplasma contractile SSD-17B TaxID=1033810 RepID=U2FKJ9_9MOLU|nr:beta-propeller domain-containing protein [Haloplasma contractile]ERJ13330.1 Beta propeller domain protein [Haloplasma contractile SSD-17B]